MSSPSSGGRQTRNSATGTENLGQGRVFHSGQTRQEPADAAELGDTGAHRAAGPGLTPPPARPACRRPLPAPHPLPGPGPGPDLGPHGAPSPSGSTAASTPSVEDLAPERCGDAPLPDPQAAEAPAACPGGPGAARPRRGRGAPRRCLRPALPGPAGGAAAAPGPSRPPARDAAGGPGLT